MTRVHICEGSPNPLANKDPHRSIFASGYGLPGPYSLADLDRGVHFEGGGVQICWDTSKTIQGQDQRLRNA